MKKTVKLFKSLSDETRLRILCLLLENGELCVCDLMHVLEQPQSTVSRHLAYLKNCGWLNDRRNGVWMYYSICSGLGGLFVELSTLLCKRCIELPECVVDQQRLLAYKHEKNCM